jgi:hypothetical protein
MWRTEAFKAEVANRVNDNQFRRFEKMYHEPLYLMNVSNNISDRHIKKYTVSGSTQNVYHVDVSPQRITCTCLDKINCRKFNCVCKHVCFVVFRVMKVARIDFFDSKTVTVSEIENAQTHNLQDVRMPIGGVPITALYNNDTLYYFDKIRNVGDDCPVCYDTLLEGSDMLGCPDCNNGIHRLCAIKWLSHSKTCVTCRSNKWKALKV